MNAHYRTVDNLVRSLYSLGQRSAQKVVEWGESAVGYVLESRFFAYTFETLRPHLPPVDETGCPLKTLLYTPYPLSDGNGTSDSSYREPPHPTSHFSRRRLEQRRDG